MAPVLSAQSHARTEAIRSAKGGEPVVCLTAYTYPVAKLLDPHVDLLLVGDSVAMVLHGHENTLGATMDMMILHVQAVMRGVRNACVVVDMPAGSYEDSAEQALACAKRIFEETHCHAVKLEGGTDMADRIAAIVKAGIPVMGHIGLQPQSVEKEGRLQAEQGNPIEAVLHHLARQDRRSLEEQQGQGCHRHEAGRQCAGVAPCTNGQCRQKCADEGKQYDEG